MISNFNNLLARRDLLRELVVTEVKAASAGTKLGWIWWLLDPLLLMLIYWAIFSLLLGRGRAIYDPYPIFILCALIPWKHFSTSAARASVILRARESLIKSIPFPTMVLPLSLVLSGFVYFLFGFVVLLVLARLWPSPHFSGNLLAVAQVPLLVVLQAAIVVGVCLPLSSLGGLFPDLGNLATYALRIGFYVSPGLYGVDMVKDAVHGALGGTYGPVGYSLYMLNPFAILFSGYRDGIFYGRFLPLDLWLILGLEAILLLVIGNAIYQHYDRRVIKFL